MELSYEVRIEKTTVADWKIWPSKRENGKRVAFG